MGEFKVYRTNEEIRDLTSRLAKGPGRKIAIGAAVLTSRLPKEAIDPSYMKNRPELVEDNGKSEVTALLDEKGIYIGLYSSSSEVPIILAYEGEIAMEVISALGFGPDPEQDACCI